MLVPFPKCVSKIISTHNELLNNLLGIDMELSGRHRAPHESVQIIKTSIVESKDVRRDHTRAYSKVSVKFPKVNPSKRAPVKNLKSTFKASRPIII